MNKMKSIISLLLCIIVPFPSLVACADKSNNKAIDNDGANIEVESTNVPGDLTFPDETFTILCREDNACGNWLHEISADEDSTELVNVAVYKRNLELCGAVIDVISALSSDMVIPAYYDMALRDKYARDDESGEMLDIIHKGFTVNFGYFYGQSLGGCSMVFRNLVNTDNTNFVSYYMVNQKGHERKLKNLLASYEDVE